MTVPSLLSTQPRISPGYRLQWEEVQQCYVLLYPEGMVQLNESAADILKYCNGEQDLAHIITELEQAFNESNLTDDIVNFIADAIERGWLRV